MHTVKKIFINSGTLAPSGYIHDFFVKNRAFLEKNGILYPKMHNPDCSGQDCPHGMLNSALKSKDALNRYLASLPISSHSNMQSECPTLILSSPSLYRFPDAASLINARLQEMFPGATIHHFASFCHQVSEITAICAILSPNTNKTIDELIEFYLKSPRVFNYSNLVHEFVDKLPNTDLYCHISPENEDAVGSESLGKNALYQFLDLITGNDKTKLACADFSPPLFNWAHTPREWANLVQAVSGSKNPPPHEFQNLDWYGQIPNIIKNVPGISKLIDEKSRSILRLRYLSSNKKFCKSLGKTEFAQPSHTHSYTGLNRKNIQPIINALDNDFLDNLRSYIQSVGDADSVDFYLIRDAAIKSDRHIEISMPDTLSVDVLTLAFNQEKYIQRCIESVLMQETSFPVRHIIVDAGSGDETPAIISRYAKMHPQRIIPILMRGHKSGNKICNLFGMCNSKYASLCDGDDYFTNIHKLQKQVDFLENNPQCALCFHPVEVVFENGLPTKIYPPENMLPGGLKRFYLLDDLFKGNFIQTNSVMYRWRFRDGLPDWFDPTFVPGDWYWHLLHAEMGKIGYLSEKMSVYWRHAASLFASAEIGPTPHRKVWGMEELRLYAALDKHFHGRYHKDLQSLANGVFADFLRVNFDSGDSSLLEKGAALAPIFAKEFLSQLKIVSAKSKK